MNEITIVRHGETLWNKLGKAQGFLDSELTELGKKQAELVGIALQNEKVDFIYSSDLGRAVKTAEIISTQLGLEFKTEEDLRERNFGILQGQTFEQFKKLWPEEYNLYKSSDPDYIIPSGESIRQRNERSTKCMFKIVKRHPDSNILIVTHGGILDSIIRTVLEIPLTVKRHFSILNSSTSKFTVTNNEWQLISWGNVNHLDNNDNFKKTDHKNCIDSIWR